ncbi:MULTISPECIES: BlaI/MecI/CopY family transcriptional regulator [unclassified Kribbella]|uniref:BlaI/MecI/CopY family transcriptional regulator n=1 Tax=unclassified Kribbella TaxID=2644121 RepID=UPI0033C05A75
MRTFGDLESVVMECLWNRSEPATVRSVLEEVQTSRKVAYTTVLTVMDNLYRKGFLARELHGRAHEYWTTRSRADYAAELMNDALAQSGDPTAALLRFVQQIPPEEAAKLQQLLSQADRPD